MRFLCDWFFRIYTALPFLVGNVEEAKTLFDVARPYYDEVLEKHNQKLLYGSPWLASGLWGKEPLNSQETIQNMKMRTYDPNGTKVFRTAGAAPIQLSWADIVPQLSTGGIDGVLTSLEAGLSASFNDYTNHFTAIFYDSTINLITMNLDTWNDLSPELQKAVTDAAKEADKHVWTNNPKVMEQAYAEARGKGMTIVTDIPADYRAMLQAASDPVIKEWVKKIGPVGEELLEKYRKAMK